ncbi:MAG: hypothetical protein PHS92_01960 [Candidatus Gracilibacteria bacterium]|nr:hypothetical protein [Candidatus Gracilibacteria bacterium]
MNNIYFYISGFFIFMGIVLSYRYIGRFEENEDQDNRNDINEPKNVFSLDMANPFFEKQISDLIRNYFNLKYNIDASKLSFEELLEKEEDEDMKGILNQIFDLLNANIYGAKGINKEELLRLFNKLKIQYGKGSEIL